jgi:hypothetical protein
MAEGGSWTYHVQGIASGCLRDAELALLLSRSHTADARAAAESPGCEFGGHCEGVRWMCGWERDRPVVVLSRLGALELACLRKVSTQRRLIGWRRWSRRHHHLHELALRLTLQHHTRLDWTGLDCVHHNNCIPMIAPSTRDSHRTTITPSTLFPTSPSCTFPRTIYQYHFRRSCQSTR